MLFRKKKAAAVPAYSSVNIQKVKGATILQKEKEQQNRTVQEFRDKGLTVKITIILN